MTANTRLTITRLLALLVVVALTIFIYLIRDQIASFERFGYAGVFLISFMSYATIVLPAPGVAIVAAMAGIFNPFWIGIFGGFGAACGESVGYLAGYSGQQIISKVKIYERLEFYTRKYGPFAVFVLSAIPNPFFDLAGAAAGALKMPAVQFFLACWIGETLKMMVFAYGGARLIQLFG